VTTTATTQVSTTTTVATAHVPEDFELLELGIAPTSCEFLPTDPNQTFVGGIPPVNGYESALQQCAAACEGYYGKHYTIHR
jgi:hypothetical protein